MNGASAPISFHHKFDNDDFVKILQNHYIKPKTRPARKHSKIGLVESGKFDLHQIFLHIFNDSMQASYTKGTFFYRLGDFLESIHRITPSPW